MDLVTLLRNYAGMAQTGAIERMLMNKAADKLEDYEKKIKEENENVSEQF